MEGISISLIIKLSLVLAILVSILVIILKIRSFMKRSGMVEIIRAMKNARKLEMDEYSRPKDVVGMTKLVEPRIVEDFSDFNKEILYSLAERNLNKIFNALESRNIEMIKKDVDLVMVQKSVEEKIEDLISCNKRVRYDSIKFNRHALKSYKKESNMATVEVSSTVEYYYKEEGNDKVKISKSFDEVKKQTRYTTKFAYIYDESKFYENTVNFAINCPNCGAPLKRHDFCSYCGSRVEPINLKCWKMISYKEDYE